MRVRILFMGTPDFAAVSLKRLVEDGHEICGVFTQPDKPRNRRHKLAFSPVKEYALSQGLTVYQPTKMRDGTALELVKSLAPELIVVVAYGRILPKDILDVPPLGCVNVHASLLPKYRGAAPSTGPSSTVTRETGVSIMYMAEELDAGDVILTAKTPIDPEEDLPALWDRLAKVGAEALAEALPAAGSGDGPRTPQDQHTGHLCAHAVP
ncbi:MAG: methionyl-tRNA formyltransferase [Dysosmobacter sp.]